MKQNGQAFRPDPRRHLENLADGKSVRHSHDRVAQSSVVGYPIKDPEIRVCEGAKPNNPVALYF